MNTTPTDIPPWMRLYVLDRERRPIRVYDTDTWMRSQFGHHFHCLVAQNALPGGVKVSTVFFGMVVNWTEPTLPALFETAVKGGRLGGFTQRYSTWEDAREGHRTIVKKCGVFDGIKMLEDA